MNNELYKIKEEKNSIIIEVKLPYSFDDKCEYIFKLDKIKNIPNIVDMAKLPEYEKEIKNKNNEILCFMIIIMKY